MMMHALRRLSVWWLVWRRWRVPPWRYEADRRAVRKYLTARVTEGSRQEQRGLPGKQARGERR